MEAALIVKSSDGTQVGKVNGLTESDLTKIKQMVTDVSTVSEKVNTIAANVVISTEDPSGGTSGQLWFKYEA